MNKKFAICVLVVFTILGQFSFSSSSDADVLINTYSNDLKVESIRLYEMAEKLKNKDVDVEAIKVQHLITRKKFKRIEFIYEYLYPEYTKSHINGAPLLQLKKHDSKPFVVPPEGLQVLDELLFGELADEDYSKVFILAQKLVEHLSILNDQLSHENIPKADILQACRLELIRIFSLGLTGFDTPGSLNALEEAKTSINGMKAVLKEMQLNGEVIELLSSAEQYLTENNDFDGFDRFYFVTVYINPIYKKLNLEKEASRLPYTAWNPQSDNIFSANFLDPYFFSELAEDEDTDLKRKIGKKLFFDLRLSKSNQMSCASCHKPELAFTDGLSKSASNVEGEKVLRNSPTLLNAIYADRFFYDLRAYSIEQQSQHVIFNHQEFNTANDEIVKKLSEDKVYLSMFEKAFEDKKVNVNNFTQALASYVLSLQALNSKFDRHLRGEDELLTESEKRGFNLFMGKANCGSCHFAPTFSGLIPPLYRENESEILGVLASPNTLKKQVDSDLGRINNQIVSEAAWIYEKSFKTTTVRNVGVTAPYFHNGAYASLNEVLKFYNQGGGLGHGLEVSNQTLSEDQLQLTNGEMVDIIAFMNSLTDTTSYEY